MMRGAIPGLEAQAIEADTPYEFDRGLFGIDEMSDEEMTSHARTVAERLAEQLRKHSPPRHVLPIGGTTA